MSKFKPGDVVRSKEYNYYGIVGTEWPDYIQPIEDCFPYALCCDGSHTWPYKWTVGRSYDADEDVELWPDKTADEVWAEFVAWRLTK